MSSRAAKSWQKALRKFERHLHLERAMAQNTTAAYVSDLTDFAIYIGEHAPDVEPSNVEGSHISAYITELNSRITDPEADATFAASSQSRRLSSLRSFFHLLLIDGEIDHDPTENISSPRGMRDLPDVLTIEEVDALIEAAGRMGSQGVRNRAIFEVLYGCGLRVSELISLRIDDLFIEAELIRVVAGKGNKHRWVPINRHALACLMEWLEERSQMEIEPTYADYLFVSYQRRKLSRIMIFKIVRKVALIAGVEKALSPHSFRHSFATHLLEGGASIRQVQEMLGHSSISSTEIYTHLDTRHLRETLSLYHPMENRNKNRGGAREPYRAK